MASENNSGCGGLIAVILFFIFFFGLAIYGILQIFAGWH